METIGFIGAGLIGGGIAQLAIKGGYKVLLTNSRDPKSLDPIIKELGDNSRAGSFKDLITDDIKIIVLSVPLKAIPKIFETGEIKDKIILDTSNYYTFRDGQIKELDDRLLTTSEYVSQYIGESNKLVKVFNNIDAIHLRISSTNDLSRQTILPISSNDVDARQLATDFIQKIGFKVLDVGGLSNSWKFEPHTPFYLTPYIPKFPENLDHDDLKSAFQSYPSPSLTVEDGIILLNSATRDGPVGGSIDTTPELVLEVMIDWYKRAKRAKSNNSSVL
ncbi:hypothetical protein BN7_1970 [Wickerhamomyces ciferrii]|uniref:Pyrroline-5-carboxylate reductase catalytic N-terminal domain-containing protein n=1 Tax=Wickerhamomyces ciferrii (strain ATCC 14091 / BCRC 22168 / CBS 111 / JCM 3599 / NBRC 0793 / NRRL Y-1031 F-60-10) TaxID=1206466 RepID=K0KBL1_WICCF|nr:uncharacterized protein BN7_1970 [Wickerhamomyces ciferrii]CCH42425.1 hypothetical protein BN7_1970 [Wickerhamomyces ciferrii]